MKRCFIFCHGFGFDKNFWQNLRPYFAKEQCIFLDLGYFGKNFVQELDVLDVLIPQCYSLDSRLCGNDIKGENYIKGGDDIRGENDNESLIHATIPLNLENNNIEFIGIGHSLGLIKLLELNIKFDYLIGLNSFVNFLGNDRNLYAVRKHDLQILIDHFIKSPAKTLRNFYKRCGVSIKSEKINKQIALEDLKLLHNKFYIPYEAQTLIIGSQNDVIVPPKILFDNFDTYRNVTVQIMDEGMHSLGLLAADSVYQKIMSFLNDND